MKIPKKKPVRKPKAFNSPRMYADFDYPANSNCVVYVGGRYYDDPVQIHLSEDDVLALAPWLNEAAKYVRAKRRVRR